MLDSPRYIWHRSASETALSKEGTAIANKRGQITVFIIIGIVVLFGAGIFFYIRNMSLEDLETEVEELPSLNLGGITNYVEGCILREAPGPIRELASNGGTLEPTSVRWYNGTQYKILCEDRANYEKCVPTLVTRQDMETELEEYLHPKLLECIDLDRFREIGTDVTEGSLWVDVHIAQEDVVIDVKYPMKFMFGDSTIDVSEFSQKLDIPIGKLYDLSMNIINYEILDGYYDQDEWMLQHGKEVLIEKHKPYPDIVYSLKKFNRQAGTELAWNFALQGKDTVSLIGLPTTLLSSGGCCHNDYDSTCYANAIQAECLAKEDTYFDIGTEDCNCPGASRYKGPDCDGGCRNCTATWDYSTQDYTGPSRVHGESWCVYDGPVGKGFDYVGSRHYKHSCFDGTEYVEECRDYRDELCTEVSITGDYPRSKAICRPNRWETCAMQTAQEECEDTTLRDCKWTPELINTEQPSYGMQRETKLCHPQVPPGFRHWQMNGYQACISANEWRTCDGLNCPDGWVTSLSQYCNYMGDCGNYRNIADRITRSGYINSDNVEAPETYYDQGLTANGLGYKLTLPLATRTLPALTGDEFANPGHEPADMLEAVREYIDWLRTQSVTNLIWQFSTKGSINIHVFGAGICGPWQAPANYLDCGQCGADKNKPCTEYQCKSLGISCIYEEEDGIGRCSSYPEDSTPPTVEFEPDVLSPGYRAAETTYLEFTGYDITPPLRLKEEFTFGFTTDEPALCSITPIPVTPGPIDPSALVGVLLSTGLANYTEEHNITFYPLGVEEAFERAVDAFQSLGIDKMEDFIDLADTYIERLDELQEEYDLDLSEQISALESATENANFDRFKQVMQDIVERRYRLFAVCVDRAGNMNEETFYVKIELEEAVPDTTPPEIVNITPEADSIMLGETAEVNVSVNEYAECRYDHLDQPYEHMRYEMRCPPSIYAMQRDRTYLCRADVNISTFAPYGRIPLFIRCRDNPHIYDDYQLKLSTSTEFIVAEESPAAMRMITLVPPSTAVITNPNVLMGDLTEIMANNPTVILSLNVTNQACRYSYQEGTLFEKMTEMICNPEGCMQELPVNNFVYHIRCHDLDDPARLEGSGTVAYEKGW